MPTADEHSPEYRRRLASAEWKRLRDQKLAEVQFRCEKCGISQWSKPLEVHHLTYITLGRERLSDLQVLCDDCHRSLHQIERSQKMKENRLQKEQRAKFGKDLYGAFDDFMRRLYGPNWSFRLTNDRINYFFAKYKEDTQ